MPRRLALRDAASAILAALSAKGRAGLDEAIKALRAAVTKPARPARTAGVPRKLRQGTKQQQELAPLRRSEGASGPAIIEVTGWASHAVRASSPASPSGDTASRSSTASARSAPRQGQLHRLPHCRGRLTIAAPRAKEPRYAVELYRVSTAEQGHSGLGLEAQQASVRAFVASQGRTLVAEFSDVASGKDDHRPGFQAALLRCKQLGAVMVAARLDRITRRAHTLSQLLEDGVSIRPADMPGADDLMTRRWRRRSAS